MAESRGKHRGHDDEHEEHVNHEAWVIPYADVLTLLMALFLVLFALGRVDEENLEIAAESFRKELSGPEFLNFGSGTGSDGPLASGGISVLDGLGPLPGETDGQDPFGDDPDRITPLPVDILEQLEGIEPEETEPTESLEALDELDLELELELADPLADVEAAVRDHAAGTGLVDAVGLRRDARGLIVTIVTDRVLFEPGAADVRDRGLPILDVVADALRDLPNDVMVEGHTDRRPISTTRYPSNWELSTARATSVLRYLVEEAGFPVERISAAGYADTRPVDTGDSADALAKNRRVEVVVLATTSGG